MQAQSFKADFVNVASNCRVCVLPLISIGVVQVFIPPYAPSQYFFFPFLQEKEEQRVRKEILALANEVK